MSAPTNSSIVESTRPRRHGVWRFCGAERQWLTWLQVDAKRNDGQHDSAWSTNADDAIRTSETHAAGLCTMFSDAHVGVVPNDTIQEVIALRHVHDGHVNLAADCPFCTGAIT